MEIRLGKDATMPTRANPTDAGLDLCAADWVHIDPGERKFVPINVAFKIPEGYVGLIFIRSSLGKKGLTLSNSVGVIDSHYRGNVGAFITNTNPKEYWNGHYMNTNPAETINKDDKFCQMVLVPIITPELEITIDTEEEWNSSTSRGVGGFGSTGT